MIHHGDCLDVLRTLPSESLDSLVTDPPAGIAFMGKDWDKDKGGRAEWIAWMTEVMRECLRVLKPGAHGLVWSLPRTSHWTATALEDAGFEVRDCVTHLFSTGFPKSLDVSKAIDKGAGATRPIIGKMKAPASTKRVETMGRPEHSGSGWQDEPMETAPATDSAHHWQGWGTALKPAAEFWWLIRKPCSEKTVAANVLKHGTGAINVDGCRVGTSEALVRPSVQRFDNQAYGKGLGAGTQVEPTGRFPANLVLSHSEGCAETCEPDCAVRMLDEQSGTLKSGAGQKNTRRSRGNTYQPPGRPDATEFQADSGGASRFFYCAKASRSDRQRKAKDGQQAPDRKEHVADEIFDQAGNAARRDRA